MPDDGLTTDVLKTLFDVITQERDARYQQQFAAHDVLQTERDRHKIELHAADVRFDVERDRRYTERADAAKEAVAAALVAQKELLAAALAASKEAVTKQETTSSQLLNALTEKIDALGKDLGGRIEQLAKSSDLGTGKGAGADATVKYLISGLGALLTVLLIVGAIYTFSQ